MAPPKLPLNFKYKVLFGSYTSPPSKPFARESPPLEALNDQHSNFHPNVASSNNDVIVAIIVDLEQDLQLSKSTMKK
jgi:hypothetical protein